MNYTGLYITCQSFMAEILLAELSLLPFNTFEETENGLNAFCDAAEFDQEAVTQIFEKYQDLDTISVEVKILPKENWNKDWEQNYDPVIVDDQIIVKAVFHEIDQRYPYEITINPKMSFGTGHHATTYLMLRQQLTIDHQGKSVYDFGTGTGVLAIMSAKLGAVKIMATDVDDWCIENSLENMQLNEVSADLKLGPVKILDIDEPADIILANINKNILLDEMTEYEKLLKPTGHLMLSGFYEHDIPEMESFAKSLGLVPVQKDVRNQWAVLVFSKPAL